MIWIRTLMFAGTVISVKYIFHLINDDGDEKIDKMKELINFTQYLRVYSCDMKMSIEEIYQKYNFKNIDIKIIVKAMIDFLEQKSDSKQYLVYINKFLSTNLEFNSYFAEIIDYYGYTYSDVLDKKLKLTSEEMERVMQEFYCRHTEKKILNNRVSFLAGCLVAIILI